MTLENIYYIGQTVAVIAILVSLGAIWVQMRQTNRLAKLETTRMIWSDATALLRSQVEDAEKADFLQRALFAGEKISDAEKTRLYLILSSMFLGLENGFAMARAGMMDEAFWPRMLASTSTYLETPRGRRWWATARERTFAPNEAFVAEIDALVARLEASEKRDATK